MKPPGGKRSSPKAPTLFDTLVRQEHGETAIGARSLRPRLPYGFETLGAVSPGLGIEEVTAAAPPLAETSTALPLSKGSGTLPIPHTADSLGVPKPRRARRADQPEIVPKTFSTASPPESPHVNIETIVNAPPRDLPSPPLPRPGNATGPATAATVALPPAENRPDRTAPIRALQPPPPRLTAPRVAPTLARNDPVIEISIGRIDIRGAPPPAATESRPAPSSPSVDRLAAYLGRRSRGSRS